MVLVRSLGVFFHQAVFEILISYGRQGVVCDGIESDCIEYISLHTVLEQATLKQASKTVSDPSHVLHTEF